MAKEIRYFVGAVVDIRFYIEKCMSNAQVAPFTRSAFIMFQVCYNANLSILMYRDVVKVLYLKIELQNSK